MNITVSLTLLLMLAGCVTAPPETSIPNGLEIDTEAEFLMNRENVQGMAIAVIDDGKIVHVAAYGYWNVERALPLTTSTIMYGASLTKTAFTYMLLQLVDEGRLNLDAPVTDLLPRPLPEYDSGDYNFTVLAEDSRWQSLTPRILLTHTSGFANFRWLEPHDERSNVRAAGSMDTTIADQSKLWSGIVQGVGLSRSSRAEMVRAHIPITSAHQFPTLSEETNPNNRNGNLAAGLGLVTFQDASGPAWFKGGHDDWTANMVVCLEKRKRCVVMLANDVRAERIYPEITKFILGETDMPWNWEYGWLEVSNR